MATVADQIVTVQGPIKMEIVRLTAVTDADTFSTLIQNPTFGLAVQNTDTNATTVATSLSFSGKTVTINDTNLSGQEVICLIFGF